jgi:cold shock CspA family protein
MAQLRGRVARFDPIKGYGFLKVPGHTDIFCHSTAIPKRDSKPLVAGEEVVFDIEVGENGRIQAAHVVRACPQNRREREDPGQRTLTSSQHS